MSLIYREAGDKMELCFENIQICMKKTSRCLHREV